MKAEQVELKGLFRLPEAEARPTAQGRAAGRRRRDRGLAQADAGADAEFLSALESNWGRLLATQATVTSDDLWNLLPADVVKDRPKRAQVIGAVIRRSAARGEIVDSGRSVRTDRASGHRRKITVWNVASRQG